VFSTNKDDDDDDDELLMNAFTYCATVDLPQGDRGPKERKLKVLSLRTISIQFSTSKWVSEWVVS